MGGLEGGGLAGTVGDSGAVEVGIPAGGAGAPGRLDVAEILALTIPREYSAGGMDYSFMSASASASLSMAFL